MADPSVQLPARLRIDALADLKAALIEAIDGADEAVVLDASAVQDVDAAGMQLVWAARKTAHQMRLQLRVEEPTEVYAKAARLLGLSETGRHG